MCLQVQTHAPFLQPTTARHQASFILVGLLIEVLALLFATAGLFVFPFLQLAVHIFLALCPFGLQSGQLVRELFQEPLPLLFLFLLPGLCRQFHRGRDR